MHQWLRDSRDRHNKASPGDDVRPPPSSSQSSAAASGALACLDYARLLCCLQLLHHSVLISASQRLPAAWVQSSGWCLPGSALAWQLLQRGWSLCLKGTLGGFAAYLPLSCPYEASLCHLAASSLHALICKLRLEISHCCMGLCSKCHL